MKFVKLTGADQVITTYSTRIGGWSIDSSGAAVVQIYNGQDATGDLVATVRFTSAGSDTQTFGGDGGGEGLLFLYQGCFFHLVSGGTITGAIWVD